MSNILGIVGLLGMILACIVYLGQIVNDLLKPSTSKHSLFIKKLKPEAVIPFRAHEEDAGMDLTCTTYEFKNDRHVYGTGLAIEIPVGHVGLIFPRSSICKYDLRLSNSVGIIDSNYRGEINAVFESGGMGDYNKIYKIGERIAQLVILPYPQVTIEEVEELAQSSRGTGSFGSSGR